MQVVVNQPNVIAVTAVSEGVYAVTTTPAPAVNVTATTTGATGLSAYEIWIGEGNTGTEQDFLDSLVSTVPGPTGPTGPQGPQGEQGERGLQGETGLTGETGSQGIQGERGLQGTQGIQGLTGETGDQGPIGLTGPAGERGFTGETGLQGIQGIQGTQGPQGTPGEVLLASFDTSFNFNRGDMVAYATIVDASMTATKVIQPFFTSALDEVAVLGMRVTERSRTPGVGFDLIAVAPYGAFGVYTARATVQGA